MGDRLQVTSNTRRALSRTLVMTQANVSSTICSAIWVNNDAGRAPVDGLELWVMNRLFGCDAGGGDSACCKA